MNKNILNIYGLGKIRFSASLASVVAVMVFYLVSNTYARYVLIINVLFFSLILVLSIWEINRSDIKGDPREVVIDEFLGMYALLLFCVPIPRWHDLVLLFICFRFFDILKVPPISWIDKWRWKYAILLDDIVIGIILGIVYKAWVIFMC